MILLIKTAWEAKNRMVEKNIDNLGRVVIPKKIRDILGIEANEKL